MNQFSNLVQQVAQRLREQERHICAAESCTGGLLLSTLTDVSGSSAYVAGGIVAYSNAIKRTILSVPAETLATHGAVSEATAHAMATQACRLFQVSVGISITGIAGPTGGTATKPVGTTYIGICVDDVCQVTHHVWDGDRIANKQASVQAALQTLLQQLT